MTPRRVKAEKVVAKVIEESGGGSYSPNTVRRWVDGKEAVPPDLATMLDAILANLPYHIRAAEAEMFWENEVSRDALRDVAGMDRARRRRYGRRQDRKSRGCRTLHIGTFDLTPQAFDAVVAMASALGMSRRAFVEQWLQRAVDRLMTEIAAEAPDGVSWARTASSRIPSSAARHLAATVSKSLD
jgi:hypothetical protein